METGTKQLLRGTMDVDGNIFRYEFSNEVWDYRTYCYYHIERVGGPEGAISSTAGAFLTHRATPESIRATIRQQASLGLL